MGYLALPFDLIPDWIPILGQVDDLLIVTSLLWLALRAISETTQNDCRQSAEQKVKLK